MKTILVTGSSGGLGMAIATKFACELQKSCTIILHCNSNENKCKELAKILKEKYGCRTHVIKADFSSQKQVEEMCNQIISKFEFVDILINNAAYVYDGEIEDRTWDLFNKTVNINLIAPFYLSKTFGLIMKKRGGVEVL